VGKELAEAAAARTKSFRQVADELDEASAPDRVAFAFMESPHITTAWLEQMASSPDGRYLLDRLYARLAEGTTGPIGGFARGMNPIPLSDDTKKLMRHASRIMEARRRAVPVEKFEQAVPGKIKIFPFKLQGLTTFSHTPMDVALSPEGKVLVELPTKLAGQYPDEYKTLPPEIINRRVEIDADEIVGIRLYDQGGETIYRPAIFLLHLDQLYTQDTAGTIQLTAGAGAAVGGGGLSSAGKAGAAKAFARADQARQRRSRVPIRPRSPSASSRGSSTRTGTGWRSRGSATCSRRSTS
jgi:hypothetical protein